jgi:hypothetical protein
LTRELLEQEQGQHNEDGDCEPDRLIALHAVLNWVVDIPYDAMWNKKVASTLPFGPSRILLAAMELDFRAFAFIIALAAVVNGLGMTRLLFGFAEYLKRRGRFEITHSGLFLAWAGLQFILHILLWWQLWTVQGVSDFTFLTYLYLLFGPILLFLGTSLLLPDLPEGALDLGEHYAEARKPFFSVTLLFWLWALFLGLVLEGAFRPAAPLLATFAAVAAGLRFTTSVRVHAVLTAVSWVLIGVFIASYSVRFG